MNIGIDIDETLTDSHEFKIAMAKQYIKDNKLSCRLVNRSAYYLEHVFDWDKHDLERFWSHSQETIFENLPVHSQATQVLARLKQDGHNLFIITARSVTDFKNPYQLSYNWLIKNKIAFDELHVEQLSKVELCKQKNISILIDDQPKNINEAIANGINTIMMNSQYNAETVVKNTTRANDWEEIYVLIKAKQGLLTL